MAGATIEGLKFTMPESRKGYAAALNDSGTALFLQMCSLLSA
jgi:hypothetical protein